MSAHPPAGIDPVPLDRLRLAGGDALAMKIIGLFLHHAPLRLTTARDAAASGDADALEQATHALKSSAGQVGAERLADICRQLEERARMKEVGNIHHGFEIRFNGKGHRIDLPGLTGGRAIMVYPQHEVLKDLTQVRLAAGGQILFETKVTALEGVTAKQPRIRFTGKDGEAKILDCDFIAGCDGGYGVSRAAIPEGSVRKDYFRIYPFGWFGILVTAPRSSEELIYAHHERGFALISTRSPEVQRMYFQCDPNDKVENWSDDRIWAELQARTALESESAKGSLQEGPIFQKGIIPLRSFVCEPMQYGRLFLAGDAAHSVPPTGAKGLNLAAADVYVMARALASFYATGSSDLLETYSATVLRRVWRVQQFSWWMTSMLHRFHDGNDFDHRRQLAELDLVTTSRSAATSLAESYVGLPLN